MQQQQSRWRVAKMTAAFDQAAARAAGVGDTILPMAEARGVTQDAGKGRNPMAMMSFDVFCDPTEVWVLQKVLAQYKIPAVVCSTDTPGTHVRLLVHADTREEGRQMQTLLEGAQAALRALRFMGHVRVPETATHNDQS